MAVWCGLPCVTHRSHIMVSPPSDGLFVAGTNITENLCYVLLHPMDSLEETTRRSLPLMTKWVRAQQPGQSPHCTNIIAGDFVGADGFVSEVISLNRKLLSP